MEMMEFIFPLYHSDFKLV